MSIACTREFSLTVEAPCLDYGHTESQVVTKADGPTTRSPARIAYDSTNDVFYSMAASSSGVFAVDPVNFAQLWFLVVGGSNGDLIFVPQTGFLYFASNNGNLYEIDVSTHLVSRSVSYTALQGRPLYLCYRDMDGGNFFTCTEFEGGLVRVDQSTMTIVAVNNTTLSKVVSPLWCPLNDRIYAYGRAGVAGTNGLACIDPDTLVVEASIPDSQTYYKVPAYSPVSEQIYLVREAYPVFQLLVIDPVLNTVVDTINIAPYFPTTTANRNWKCYAFGCNVYVISTQTTEYAVFKAEDNSLIASGTWSQKALCMAAGKDVVEGIAFCANVYPSPYVRVTPP